MITLCPKCRTLNRAATPLSSGTIACIACRGIFDPNSIGMFRIGQVMRAGVADTAYEGEDLESGSAVALKLPVFTRSQPVQEVDRFFGQVNELSYLGHPSLLPLHTAGLTDSGPWAASTLPAGTPFLADLLAGRPSVDLAVALVMDLAEVLHFAHERWSMVHGDLNPRAILMRSTSCAQERPRPSILAVCLSKRELSENAEGVESPVLRATPYMSPEQRGGVVQRVDVRSDVYSLGAILYHVASGSPPPAAGAVASVSGRLSLAQEGGLAVLLNRIIARAMAEDPRERYQSAAALASDLGELGNGA
jgi:serine/threonine protein kinase